ncbi:hypothetical protein R3P38DRAFT_3517660 [Favolaschia claudopus]|uniref:C2H2-type domain-containing protein n=1 Tax=Favolaschia claudopus TaxID=2862362 RepID=A0AAW0BQ48_9AGAR
MLSVRTSYSTQGHKERDKDDAQLRSSSEPSPARRHHCPRLGCGKSFSSPGHLRRHLPIHTGQKNHPCPFPGCRMKCSRQDNLQQHYKIHFKTDTPLRKAPPKRKIIKIHDLTPAIIFGSGPSSVELHDPSLPSINSPPPLEEAHFPSAMFDLRGCNPSPSPSMNSPPPLREAYYPLRRVDCWPQMILSTPITQIAPPVLPATFDNTQSPRYSVSDPHFRLPKLEMTGVEDREASVDTLAYAESQCTSSEYTGSSCSPPSWIPDSGSTSPAISLEHPIPRVSQPRSRLLDYSPCGEELYDPASPMSTYSPPSVPYQQYPASLLSPIHLALEYGNEPHSWQPFQAFTSDGFISAPPPRRRHLYPQSVATNMGTCNVSAHRAQNSGYIY